MNAADPGPAVVAAGLSPAAPAAATPAFQPASRPAPLWAVLTFAFVNSVCGGAAGIGVFFIAKQAYGFSPLRNFALGVMGGAIYVLGALAVGPLLARLIRVSVVVTTRRALAAIMLVMAAACAGAWLLPREWTIWAFVAAYQALSGALWPIVESYLSGGRRGQGLRSAVGRFNVAWAGAIAISGWAMAGALDAAPLAVLAGVGALHLLVLGVLPMLPPDPARHVHEEHEPHPSSYAPLLATSRWLLALSYLLMYGVSPALPAKVEALGVLVVWQTPLVSAWMIARVLTFGVMERWHGWHGRWGTALGAGGAMIAGFVCVVLATSVPALVAGLVLFGAGVGCVYCAALYYAMEVGAAEVEAGGKHEATIGAGMTLGPAAGCAAWLLAERSGAGGPGSETLFLALAGAFVCVGVALAARPWLAWRRAARR